MNCLVNRHNKKKSHEEEKERNQTTIFIAKKKHAGNEKVTIYTLITSCNKTNLVIEASVYDIQSQNSSVDHFLGECGYVVREGFCFVCV